MPPTEQLSIESGVAGTRCSSGPAPPRMPRGIRQLLQFFSSWRFPVLALGILASVELFQVLMLLLPAGHTGLGAFAEEFRVWCYGLDPATGGLEWGYVGMFLAQPAVISLALGVIWHAPIRQVFRSTPKQTLPYLGTSAVVVAAVLFSLVSLGAPQRAEAAFPAAALRMDKPAFPLVLWDQDGERVTLAGLRGKVVVVTGVYATCSHTCPLIMAQVRRSVEKLDPKDRSLVRVLAITLNPDFDKQPVLQQASVRYQAPKPIYRFLGGPSTEVNSVLDAFEIARKMNHGTKQIDHANLFIVLDKRGRVAYRLTLGEQQEKWLTDAMRLLAKEA